MKDQLSETLTWFANFTNFYSVLSVIICFCVMVVFILRLNGDHFMSSSATHYNVAHEERMTTLHNPFSLQLLSDSVTSLKKGLHLQLSVSKESKLRLFWGVNIQAFQKELNLTAAKIVSRLETGKTFAEQFLHSDDSERITPGMSKTEWHIHCPSEMTVETLGEPPRCKYPLVAVMVRTDGNVTDHFTAVMTQFTVIHLKDELCTLDSHIVYQFLKTNHNNLITLQPIFVSHDEEYREFDHNNRPTSEINRTTDDGQSSGVQDIPTDPAFSESKTDSDSDVNINHINGCCCICQTLPIFYTLLPCRHACVCRSCLKPLDKCPICRTYIDSYFRIGHQLQSEEGQSPNETVSLTRWQLLNQRVNEWLGFT